MDEIVNFPLGARVRSYDFPGSRDDCYVEGVVTGLDRQHERYCIRVDRQVWGGEPATQFVGLTVCPPFNGLRSLLTGELTNGVVAASL